MSTKRRQDLGLGSTPAGGSGGSFAAHSREAAAPPAVSRPESYIPATLQAHIEEALGTGDYAPYVLDGQSADLTGDEEDWHDVVAVVEDQSGIRAVKFTMLPSGIIEHYDLADPGKVTRTMPAGDLHSVKLADGATLSIPADRWTPEAQMAFTEGQCVAFAVEHAKRTPGAKVRMFWRADGELEHAAVFNPETDTVTDSYGRYPSTRWNDMWRQTHLGESPEWDDFTPERAIGEAANLELLPEQDYEFAGKLMSVVPEQIAP